MLSKCTAEFIKLETAIREIDKKKRLAGTKLYKEGYIQVKIYGRLCIRTLMLFKL